MTITQADFDRIFDASDELSKGTSLAQVLYNGLENLHESSDEDSFYGLVSDTLQVITETIQGANINLYAVLEQIKHSSFRQEKTSTSSSTTVKVEINA